TPLMHPFRDGARNGHARAHRFRARPPLHRRLAGDGAALYERAARWGSKASCRGAPMRRTVASRGCLLTNVFSEPVDCGLYAAHAVRYPQGVEANLDNAEYTQDHRRIDVSHVRDPKSLAGQFTDANAKHDTALVVAIVHQLARISIAIHDNGRDCVGTLVCFRNVEPERMALRPPTNGTAHRLCQQAMP